jgi:hypothetical protein
MRKAVGGCAQRYVALVKSRGGLHNGHPPAPPLLCAAVLEAVHPSLSK